MRLVDIISISICKLVGFTFFYACWLASKLGRIFLGPHALNNTYLNTPNTLDHAMQTGTNNPHGISIIIPERGNPEMLRACINSLEKALSHINEPQQIIVVVNGTDLTPYEQLSHEFPTIEWLNSINPLGFSSAISMGLAQAQYEWVFLLNNDMH